MLVQFIHTHQCPGMEKVDALSGWPHDLCNDVGTAVVHDKDGPHDK